jgi:hypothetical protein
MRYLQRKREQRKERGKLNVEVKKGGMLCLVPGVEKVESHQYIALFVVELSQLILMGLFAAYVEKELRRK